MCRLLVCRLADVNLAQKMCVWCLLVVVSVVYTHRLWRSLIYVFLPMLRRPFFLRSLAG